MFKIHVKTKDINGAIAGKMPLEQYVAGVATEGSTGEGQLENMVANDRYIGEVLGRVLAYLVAKDRRIGVAELETFLFGEPTGQLGGIEFTPEKDDDVPF